MRYSPKPCTSGKKKFLTKVSAQAAATRISRTDLEFYECSDCGLWHQGRPWRHFRMKRQLEDSLRELREGFKKARQEFLDRQRKILAEKYARVIEADLRKQAELVELEARRTWDELDTADNLRIAQALVEQDLAKARKKK